MSNENLWSPYCPHCGSNETHFDTHYTVVNDESFRGIEKVSETNGHCMMCKCVFAFQIKEFSHDDPVLERQTG